MYFYPEPAGAPKAAAPAPTLPTPRCGVLLINLGSPAAPEPGTVRRYLAEFLSDRRVIELSPWLWQPILRALIAPLRASASAARYRAVWQPEGAPLLVHSKAQTKLLAGSLLQRGVRAKVRLAMRYGHPSVAGALERLKKDGCTHILAVPMYPQYSATTIGSAADAVHAWAQRCRVQPALRISGSFPLFAPWLRAVARHVRAYWQRQGQPQRVVLSFHGVPQRMVQQGDPYEAQCRASAARLAAELGLAAGQWELAFQSRFGHGRWLTPSTQEVLQRLGREGAGRVDVFCPGFVADCLETLEEIGIEGQKLFKKAGGGEFHLIACLNDSPHWIEALADWVQLNLQGWPVANIPDAAVTADG